MGKENIIIDNHGRKINYVRLAVTDRCNLRCHYCMPEEGIDFVPRDELLTYEEMLRLLTLMSTMGIDKLRITGGEPFVRKDLIHFLEEASKIPGIRHIHLTTNGTTTIRHLKKLKQLGISQVNLSLDSLDAERFYKITRRDCFDQVWNCLQEMLDMGFQVKINAVVMDGQNTEDLIPFARLTQEKDIEVRFIEEMPFNGSGELEASTPWDYVRILEHLRSDFPSIRPMPAPPHSTSTMYKIPGHRGHIGIIAAYSRTFCGTCNRIRITPQGVLKTCLYDSGIFNVRDLLRQDASDDQVREAILAACSNRFRDGFEAENNRKGQRPVSESMSTIGG
jgi:molybdenum cofactor biosynthesis protein A